MKILSLDTAMAACSAAVVDTGHPLPLAEAYQPMERGHAEALAPMVSEVLRAAGLSMADLDRIAVTIGPGTFTGVRIALSFARGLGLARGIPVIGIDSLSAIAANEEISAPLLVLSDARNGEVYASAFDSERRMITAPHITTPAVAAHSMPPGTLVIGTAKQSAITARGGGDLSPSHASDFPVAARFARLAVHAPHGNMPAPLYLRAPDAKPQTASLRKASMLVFEAVSGLAAPLLATLHAETFESPWTAESFEQLLRMPGAATLVAFEQGEPAGFVMTRQAADEAEIITIATRVQFQRRGVARQLLMRQLSKLGTQGVHQVFLEVAASNAAALGLYQAMGFTEAGRRKGYYERQNGREDAIIMRRELSP